MSVDGFEEFMMSLLAWYIMVILGLAVRGRD